MRILGWIREAGISGWMDIFFMTLLIYAVLVWFKRTRSAFVLTGIVIVSGLYLLARQFSLDLTAAVFEKFFAVILIALVVIFQEELRHFFEQVAVWSLDRRLLRKKTVSLSRKEVEILVRILTDLARERIGALIVLRGKDMIVRHLEGGIDLNGEMSEPLLKSLFDPHSMGHDGATILEGRQVTQFSCHLPLSKNLEKMGKGGTRHAAALGLSELSDALCMVVSEERGTISIARYGDIKIISDPERLTEILESFYDEVGPQRTARTWHDFFRRNSREKLIALILACALWFVLVFSSKPMTKKFTVEVTAQNLPKPWVVQVVSPKTVHILLQGPRGAFYFLTKDQIRLALRLNLERGVQKIFIFPTDVSLPKGFIIENIEPRQVKMVLTEVPDKN